MHRALVVAALFVSSLASASVDSPFGGAETTDTGEGAPGSPFRAEALAAPDSLVAGQVAELRFVLRIPAEHYVYAERCTLELLPDPGLEVVGLQEPISEKKLDPFMEEEVEVHKHDATFVARVRAGWPLTVRAVLASQGCSTAMCFFPQGDTLAVQLAVTGTAQGRRLGQPKPVRGIASSSGSKLRRLEASRGFWCSPSAPASRPASHPASTR